MGSQETIRLTEQYSAHNYHPLDVVIREASGVWVTDPEGRRYMDMLSAYSALNFGHCNPRIQRAAERQLKKVTLTSRAFYSEELGAFCRDLAELCGMEMVLPMNSGAEAVETAIKCARRWGYQVKRVPENKAEIITFSGNFHGRTTTIVSFSSSSSAREDYGPFTPGFVVVPYGDIDALRRAVTPHTVGILFEPIQGEGGIIIPYEGFLQEMRTLCSEERILMIADEIQTGLCRTGEIFACDHEAVSPDMYILGKSLGGGIVPISAVVSRKEILEVFTPGSHGSTFGGNSFACAIAREVLTLIKEEQPHVNAREMGHYFSEQLRQIQMRASGKIGAIRSRGLFIGVDVPVSFGPAYGFCEKLRQVGVLSKDTREQTIRFAPPLTITKDEIDWALERIRQVFTGHSRMDSTNSDEGGSVSSRDGVGK